MARKRGKESNSRNAILDAAWELLRAPGAAGMSVEAIVSRAGLSKGTFFHFFPSKQHLLDALCERIAAISSTDAAQVLEQTDLDPVERLDRYFRRWRAWRKEHPKALGELWWELARDENAVLLRKVTALGNARLAPVLASLIDEGNAKGLMRVADTQTVAQLIAEWMSSTVDGSLRRFLELSDATSVDLALRRANATITAVERILGLAEASLSRVDQSTVSKIATAIPLAEQTGVREPRKHIETKKVRKRKKKGPRSHG